MYEAFFGLSEKPFALTPNPRFVFQSEQYRTAEQALLYGIAQKEGFMVYAIGLEGQVLGRRTRPDRNLRRLAAETGGGHFELRDTADLNTTFTRVADELHRQYVLGFSPENLDGTTHKLEVRVKVPGMTVRARQSYVASEEATAAGLPDATAP